MFYRIKNLLNIIIYFVVISFIIPMVFIIVGTQIYGDSNSNEVISFLFNNIGLVTLLSNLAVFLILLLLNYHDLKTMQWGKIKLKKTYSWYVIGFVAYFGGLLVLNALITYFSQGYTQPDNEAAVNEMLFGENKIFAILAVAIFAPLTEELVFRYSLVNLFYIDKKYFRWIAYLLSAIVFSLIHESAVIYSLSTVNIFHFLSYFIPSLILCAIYYLSNNNLITLFLMHMSINAFSLVLTYFVS